MGNEKSFRSDHSWLDRLKKPPTYVLLMPQLGILTFLALYVMAAMAYPGGSAARPTHPGFDFWNNYLCDLLDEFAINGELNSARFYARAALFALCTGLVLLWFYLPLLFARKSRLHFLMWSAGIVSLLILFLMGTRNHDLIVRLAGVFGIAAFLLCAIALIRDGWQKLGILGFSCLSVFLINYFIYETGVYRSALPLIQKGTFLLCISWFTGLNYTLYKKVKNTV